jgi:hypothetical protein
MVELLLTWELEEFATSDVLVEHTEFFHLVFITMG